MGRIATSKETIQERLDAQFPGRGLKVLEFSTLKSAGVIECPVHGSQSVNFFSSIFRSPTGCPKCGQESSAKKSGKRMSDLFSLEGNSLQAVTKIRELPPTLSDYEFRIKVLEILSNT